MKSDKINAVFDIPDDYRFMEPELVNLICSAVDPIIGAMDDPTEN